MKITSEKMNKTIENLKSQFDSVRTNRAHPELIEKIPVQYYGTSTPLQQLANISAPEPRLLLIQVFDANATKDIERAIQSSNLSLTPQTEGQSIRINLPDLTEERRKEIVKHLHKLAEDGKNMRLSLKSKCLLK